MAVTGIREFNCRNLESNTVHETEPSDGSVQCLTFGHISLVSGLLSSVTSTLLRQPVSDQPCGALNMWLFEVTCDLCANSEHQFHAFSTLQLWFHKMSALLGDMVGVGLTFRSDGHVSGRTLQLVWTHLDSPVDGVNDCVIDVLKALIKLQQEEGDLRGKDGETFPAKGGLEEQDSGSVVDLILPQVVNLPWNVRGRYGLLTVLLPHLNIDQVSMNHF